MAFLLRDLRVGRQTEVREISLGKIGFFQGSLRSECTLGGTHHIAKYLFIGTLLYVLFCDQGGTS